MVVDSVDNLSKGGAAMRFWKSMAVLTVLGVFYVGYGLRGAPGAGRQQAMPWESVAHGLVIDPEYSPWGGRPVAVTASADGQTLYFWDRANNGAVAVRVTAGNLGLPGAPGPGFEGVHDRGPRAAPGRAQPGDPRVGPAQPAPARRQIPMITTPQKNKNVNTD